VGSQEEPQTIMDIPDVLLNHQIVPVQQQQ
jgi:hypothetical protein